LRTLQAPSNATWPCCPRASRKQRGNVEPGELRTQRAVIGPRPRMPLPFVTSGVSHKHISPLHERGPVLGAAVRPVCRRIRCRARQHRLAGRSSSCSPHECRRSCSADRRQSAARPIRFAVLGIFRRATGRATLIRYGGSHGLALRGPHSVVSLARSTETPSRLETFGPSGARLLLSRFPRER